jgi:hypothetical protein
MPEAYQINSRAASHTARSGPDPSEVVTVDRIDGGLAHTAARTDIGEMAQFAAAESLSALCGAHATLLFGSTSETVKPAGGIECLHPFAASPLVDFTAAAGRSQKGGQSMKRQGPTRQQREQQLRQMMKTKTGREEVERLLLGCFKPGELPPVGSIAIETILAHEFPSPPRTWTT